MSLRRFDARYRLRGIGLAGADEAGRGALAGPVVAAVAFLPEAFYTCSKCRRQTQAANDSKQLHPEVRNRLFDTLCALAENKAIFFASGTADLAEIAQLNIYQANALALTRACESLSDQLSGLHLSLNREPEFFSPPTPPHLGTSQTYTVPLLLDGKPIRTLPYRHTAIVKGDAKSLAIALASIVAKVTRDRLMADLDATYPHYGFARHKGYGTEEHRAALQTHGPCTIHRVSFLSKILGT